MTHTVLSWCLPVGVRVRSALSFRTWPRSDIWARSGGELNRLLGRASGIYSLLFNCVLMTWCCLGWFECSHNPLHASALPRQPKTALSWSLQDDVMQLSGVSLASFGNCRGTEELVQTQVTINCRLIFGLQCHTVNNKPVKTKAQSSN